MLFTFLFSKISALDPKAQPGINNRALPSPCPPLIRFGLTICTFPSISSSCLQSVLSRMNGGGEAVEDILRGLASQIAEREDAVLCSDVRNKVRKDRKKCPKMTKIF